MNIKIALSSFMMVYALGACSSIAEQSPQDMIRHSMQRQFKQDHAYQFKGIAYAQLADFESKPSSEDDELSASRQQTREKLQEKIRKYVQRFSQGITMPYTGAVDWSQGKIEWVPDLRLQTRNSLSSTKLPIQLDFKNMKLYADAEAITFWADPLLDIAEIPPVDDRYLMLQLPQLQQKRIPLIKDIVKTLPEAMDKGYSALPSDRFTRLPMNEMGKNIHAAYRIGADINMADYSTMSKATFASVHEQLSKNPPPQGISQEEYQKILNTLEQWQSQINDLNNTQDKDITDAIHGIKTHNEWYLDKKGRLLASSSELIFSEKINQLLSEMLGKNKTLHFHQQQSVHYTKKPIFTIQANENNVYDLTCLLEDSESCPFLKKSKEKKHDDDSNKLMNDDAATPALHYRPNTVLPKANRQKTAHQRLHKK